MAEERKVLEVSRGSSSERNDKEEEDYGAEGEASSEISDRAEERSRAGRRVILREVAAKRKILELKKGAVLRAVAEERKILLLM